MTRAVCVEDTPIDHGDTLVAAPDRTDQVRCGGCGEWHPASCWSCPDCVTCDHCKAVVPDTDTVDTVRGSTICPDCRQGWYSQCPICDGWNRDGDDCGTYDCTDDEEDEEEEDDDDSGGLLHDYDYKPRPVFHGTGPVFLGVEIELETPSNRRECAAIAEDFLGDLGYLKDDGSLD
jgi:hypothetical protein